MDTVVGWEDNYSLIQNAALTCRAGMVRLRSVFGQQDPGSGDSGKVMLYRFTSILALCFHHETAYSHTLQGRKDNPGSCRDR
jgi:hypothetical protein